jgi:hypothetical protein
MSQPEPEHSAAMKRLTTFWLLGSLLREQEHPAQPELRLTRDGWEVRGGDLKEPLPVHADMAYEMSGFDQRVLDETRRLCGELRFPAKRSHVIRQQLADLRAGLERARAVKAARAASTDSGQA